MDENDRQEILAAAHGDYKVIDQIAENQERRTKWRENKDWREKMQGVGMTEPQVLDKSKTYPNQAEYTFQEFAGPVFEFGGYGDMTMIDPYTLRRLWVGKEFLFEGTTYDWMRRVIDLAEAIDFLHDHEEAP
jgi:hypothetical protein